MIRLTNFRLPIHVSDHLHQHVASHLSVPPDQLQMVRILKRSLDARKKPKLFYVYTLQVFLRGDTLPVPPPPLPHHQPPRFPPIIIGAGPGGLFAALRLLEHGVPSRLFERGERIHPRTLKINRFWKHGLLDLDSNVCFGEGGAGLFSDGKLITRIKSPHIRYVLERLVHFGAPAEILYVNNPHVGSNRLRKVIKALVQHLAEAGCQLHFNTRVASLLLDEARQIQGIRLANGHDILGDQVFLATGHSARDLYQQLANQGVALEPKDYAMGVRVEHPQALINRIQLGEAAPSSLGAAQYRLTYNTAQSRVYSFCMCPGGYVLSSGTEADGVVVNGMSNHRRSSRWANAALVTPVTARDIPGNDPFRLLHHQRTAEKRAFHEVQAAGGTKELPAQRLIDFLDGCTSRSLPVVSSPSGAISVDLTRVLPDKVTEALRDSLETFDRRMPGYICPEAVLLAVESRTSAPLRVPRDAVTLQSVNTPGLYPVGEGAGYAGGITSAAVDGIRAVSAMLTEAEPTQERVPSTKPPLEALK